MSVGGPPGRDKMGVRAGRRLWPPVAAAAPMARGRRRAQPPRAMARPEGRPGFAEARGPPRRARVSRMHASRPGSLHANWEKPTARWSSTPARLETGPPRERSATPALRLNEGNDLVFPSTTGGRSSGSTPADSGAGRPTRRRPTGLAPTGRPHRPRGQPCTWLYFTHTSDNTHRPITWHLRDTHGGRRESQVVVPGGAATGIASRRHGVGVTGP